jgi:hypothetical protein
MYVVPLRANLKCAKSQSERDRCDALHTVWATGETARRPLRSSSAAWRSGLKREFIKNICSRPEPLTSKKSRASNLDGRCIWLNAHGAADGSFVHRQRRRLANLSKIDAEKQHIGQAGGQ